jgi:hypothetical protein
MSRFFQIAVVGVLSLVFVPAVRAQEDKVLRGLTPEAAEALLKELKIEFVKSSSKRGDEHYYDFKRDAFKVRLTQFSAQEIMLDCVFRGVPMEKVNMWNASTRFTRASLHKDTSGEFTLLEYGLDLTGSVTTGTLKLFIVRFDDELKKYEKFVGAGGSDDQILPSVTDDKIENILKTQSVNYTKKANTSGIMMFDFELNGQKLRLYNFGGKDLMIDVHFRKVSLESANAFNLAKKFVRVVNYKSKDSEYTALESNLDCEGGVSTGMVRHWIMSFGDDARDFAEHAKKTNGDKK